MRLIDELRAGGRLRMPYLVEQCHEHTWAEMAGHLHQVLCNPSLPVLLIDNVSDYYFTGSSQERWDLTRDFPNLAPPFPVSWFEHRLPKTIHSEECGDTDFARLLPQGRVGVLIHGLTRGEWTGQEIPDNAKWILWGEVFIDYGAHGSVCGPHGSMFLAIDESGAIIGQPWLQSLAGVEHASLMPSYITFLHPALLAISFLHCRNVQLVDNPLPAKLVKRYRERHGGLIPAVCKTLVIEPLKQILRTEGRQAEVGLARAMHICRGHFKDYREGRGLFGKYHQLVWQPSIVRGTKGRSAPPREIEVKV